MEFWLFGLFVLSSLGTSTCKYLPWIITLNQIGFFCLEALPHIPDEYFCQFISRKNEYEDSGTCLFLETHRWYQDPGKKQRKSQRSSTTPKKQIQNNLKDQRGKQHFSLLSQATWRWIFLISQQPRMVFRSWAHQNVKH